MLAKLNKNIDTSNKKNKQMTFKHVQKLIFINVGVYVGIMTYFLILNPHKVKEFLKVNEPFLRALVKEPPRTSNRGRKRIA